MVEAHATALSRTGDVVEQSHSKWVNCSEKFWPRGPLSVTKQHPLVFDLWSVMDVYVACKEVNALATVDATWDMFWETRGVLYNRTYSIPACFFNHTYV